ncbi:2TM domain-containing protein [Maribacter sp. HTCC2170]|uniref:2TM domain-containing protein n=1 Tax=Maribacter sp. (strain HTCC2170 / KCCM 42371) TaxID=313603 RepID=UPI00006B48D1|nr:2TM domain-containing protein [Maribacter sp. HTCC2170]EAR01671.1 hypothetical protein FB2170_14123 [Maribacter sp. HTCC2170]
MEENINGRVLLKKAEKRVDGIKRFYRHLSVYIAVNIVLVGVYATLYNQFNWQDIIDPDFHYWWMINLVSTPLLWGVGVLIHGLFAFNVIKSNKTKSASGFIKKWEERQIKKYLEKNN